MKSNQNPFSRSRVSHADGPNDITKLAVAVSNLVNALLKTRNSVKFNVFPLIRQ